MSDVEDLKKKLVAGQNENAKGYRKFAVAQFYDNLTKEQYSGVSKRPAGVLSASRDSLNPLLNTNVLKERLALIEHYRYKNGVEHARWPHFAMGRLGRHMWRFKGNYAVKGAAAFLVYSDIMYRRNMHESTYVTIQQDAVMLSRTAMHTGLFLGLCALI